MKKQAENLLKSVLPPVILEFIHDFRHCSTFRGDYRSWEAARGASQGYDSDAIVEKVRGSLERVKRGEAAFERDSKAFQEPGYWWPLVSALLWAASRNGNSLNLLDFGGSLGGTYYHCLNFIKHLEPKWSIVEQEKFVKVGRLHFRNEQLNFFYSIDECVKTNNPCTVLLSGVLQYLEKPHELLQELVQRDFHQIIIDRTPFLDGKTEQDRLTVQKAARRCYSGSYPAWLFNRDRFLATFAQEYDLIAEFDSFDKFPRAGIPARSKGFIFEKRQKGQRAQAPDPQLGGSP